LVKNQQVENKYIEYKQQLPGDTDSEKKEFLADVSSFANASGGDLIYGIRTEHGVPTEFCGLQLSNPDQEISRLETMIRCGIAPRINVQTTLIAETKQAIIIRIRKSWAAPHMVTFKGLSKFYSRNSNGKYPLDVTELRAAFLLTDTIGERARHFRNNRLNKILSGETPLREKTPKTVLHLIPFGSLDPSAKFDLSQLTADMTKLMSPGLERNIPWGRYNFDGYLTVTQLGQKTWSYLQIFRNGIIELVDTYLLGNQRKIYSYDFEKGLLEAIPRYLNAQKTIGVDTPIFLTVSLHGVSGFELEPCGPPRVSMDQHYPIDRDDLVIPELVVDEFDARLDRIMKPIFDTIWNAAGWPGCQNYNEKEEWQGRQGL
jgi:hypothetical protein